MILQRLKRVSTVKRKKKILKFREIAVAQNFSTFPKKGMLNLTYNLFDSDIQAIQLIVTIENQIIDDISANIDFFFNSV